MTFCYHSPAAKRRGSSGAFPNAVFTLIPNGQAGALVLHFSDLERRVRFAADTRSNRRGERMALHGQIEHLSNQHKKIDAIIAAEMSNPDWDEIRVAALKKQKLRIKDELARLQAAIN